MPDTVSLNNYDMMTCPYNGAHRVTAKRFVRHLLKCRRAHPNVEMLMCPYNARHVVPVPEFRYHLKYCVDGHLLDEEQKKQYRSSNHGSELKGDTTIPPPMSHHCEFDEDENWDEEIKREDATKKHSEVMRRVRRPHNFSDVQRVVLVASSMAKHSPAQ